MSLTLEFGPPLEWHETLSRAGIIIVAAGVARVRFKATSVITQVTAVIGTAPTGSDLICDVNLNGSTIFTTQANRPTIPAGTNEGASGTPNITNAGPGDYLTVDVDQVGSTVQGSDLTIQIYYTLP